MSTAYLLDAIPAERHRLLTQGDMFRREAELLLDQCQLNIGQKAVDVGCGPLGIMHLMADRVGPGGSVVGVDGDPEMVAAAAQNAQMLGFENVSLIHGSAYDSHLAPRSFDLAHSRLLLVNVPDPAAVVRHMESLVRPGGHVALQDIDWINRICDPPHPAWDRVIEIVGDLWRQDGMDPNIGRRLPAMLADVGLVDIDVSATTRAFRRGHPTQTLMVDRAEKCREALVKRSLISDRELDECLSELRTHLDRVGTVVFHGTLVQAWARVPHA